MDNSDFAIRAVIVSLALICWLSICVVACCCRAICSCHTSRKGASKQVRNYRMKHLNAAWDDLETGLWDRSANAQPANIAQVPKAECVVLDIDEDTEPAAFARLVDVILLPASSVAAVIVRINSGGGPVDKYGALYQSMIRLREDPRIVHLRACVDECAASGGYLVACPAHHIQANPLATVGSIGVVSQAFNVTALLNKVGVHVDTFSAGKNKVAYNPFAHNDDATMEFERAELAIVHDAFKYAVATYRPLVDLAQVSTGQAWLGCDSLGLGLIDSVASSNEYILSLQQTHEIRRLFKRDEDRPNGILRGAMGFAKGLFSYRRRQ